MTILYRVCRVYVMLATLTAATSCCTTNLDNEKETYPFGITGAKTDNLEDILALKEEVDTMYRCMKPLGTRYLDNKLKMARDSVLSEEQQKQHEIIKKQCIAVEFAVIVAEYKALMKIMKSGIDGGHPLARPPRALSGGHREHRHTH